ncbi:MAG: hypothetical protein NC489_30680 [Ruminococcus flavefaciens]|nr:hypothetical protein [Ruminococcus flavefaciens]
MNTKAIVVSKEYAGGEYDIPDVFLLEGDTMSDSDNERACAIMGMLYDNYLEAEEAETAIPIDHGNTFRSAAGDYAKIAWANGDVRRYFLTETQDIPGMEDDGASHRNAGAGKTEAEDDTPWSGQVLSLSTVHVVPEAVDFLSAPMNSDKLQIFPNSDSCVMHVTDAENALGYDLPLCIKDCIRYAWKKGCPWIYFGNEGKERKELPTYRSAWDRV